MNDILPSLQKRRTWIFDHRLLAFSLRLCTKACKQTSAPTKRYNTDDLNNQTIASKYAVEVHNRYALLQNLDPGDQNINDAWETFKCAIHESAYKSLGKPHVPKKTWISEPTLNIIEDRRAARLCGDKPEVKRLTRERNRALGLDQGRYWDAKAAAIESAVARQDQHTVFRKLRTCKLGLNNQSTTVQAEDGTVLTNIKDCLCRWKGHFNDLLNKPFVAKTPNSSVMLNKQHLMRTRTLTQSQAVKGLKNRRVMKHLLHHCRTAKKRWGLNVAGVHNQHCMDQENHPR